MGKIHKNLVIVNQASNYLTIGFCNAFYEKFENVALITGSIHVQGEELNSEIKVSYINKWQEAPASKKFLSYVVGTIRIYFLVLFKYRGYEVLFVSLPPMGYLTSLFLPNRCSMIIWDVYPDAFKIMGWTEKNLIYKLWSNLNKVCFKRAYRVITISEVMAETLSKYIEKSKLRIQPIWSIFQGENPIEKEKNAFIKEHGLHNKFIIQYSGNIGLSHNVELIVDLAEKLKSRNDILFQIIGRGPKKKSIMKLVSDKNLDNCVFLPFQSDEMFPFSLSAADIGIVILDETTSQGSVPSKSYNIMSYGIPSLYLAGKKSQLAKYVEQYNHGICVDHANLDLAVKFIIELKTNPSRLNEFKNNSLEAACDFRSSNSEKFVDLYLDSE